MPSESPRAIRSGSARRRRQERRNDGCTISHVQGICRLLSRASAILVLRPSCWRPTRIAKTLSARQYRGIVDNNRTQTCLHARAPEFVNHHKIVGSGTAPEGTTFRPFNIRPPPAPHTCFHTAPHRKRYITWDSRHAGEGANRGPTLQNRPELSSRKSRRRPPNSPEGQLSAPFVRGADFTGHPDLRHSRVSTTGRGRTHSHLLKLLSLSPACPTAL